MRTKWIMTSLTIAGLCALLGACRGFDASLTDLNPIETGSTCNATVKVAWDPPLELVDGTPITDLSGYRIFSGNAPGSYQSVTLVNDPAVGLWSFGGLGLGNHYFALTALTASGGESALSNEAVAPVTVCPSVVFVSLSSKK
jgi:hypothetical protein